MAELYVNVEASSCVDIKGNYRFFVFSGALRA
jgi:hypothetical protein